MTTRVSASHQLTSQANKDVVYFHRDEIIPRALVIVCFDG